MAAANFAGALAIELAHEGGYVDHPRDPGGATNLGITLATLRRHKPGATKADVKALTPATVAPIYRRDYWDAVRGDDLPSGVDLATFDPAVNSGPPRAAKWLQGALSVAVDGQIGSATIAAAHAAPDKTAVIRRLCRARMSFLGALKTFDVFGKGWTRRVASIEATSIAWAVAAAGGQLGPVVKPEIARANTASKRSAGGAATAGGSGAAGGTQLDPAHADALATVALIGFIGAALGVGLYLFWRSRAERERANALQAVLAAGGRHGVA